MQVYQEFCFQCMGTTECCWYLTFHVKWIDSLSYTLHLRLFTSLSFRHLTLNPLSISQDTNHHFFHSLINTYLCKYHLSSTESINKHRWAISRNGVCGPLSHVTSIQLVTPVTPYVPRKIRPRGSREYRKPYSEYNRISLSQSAA